MSLPLPSYREAAALVAACAAQIPAPSRLAPSSIERVELASAAGRVLAHPLRADSDQPAFARSTRDGYACRAAEAAAHAWLRVTGSTRAGEAPAPPLAPGAAWEIMTGAPVPEGADAVAMLEHVDAEAGGIRLHAARALTAGENIVPQGAQARAGDPLLAAGTLIGPAQIALAAACGAAVLDVYTRPRVAILSTGDEVIPVEGQPAPGQIRNSNAPMLAALVAAAGGEPWILPTAADTADALNAALEVASTADLLLISGGVSAGKFDLVEPALLQRGARFYFTGVRMQPGRPVAFGEVPPPATALVQNENSTKYQSPAQRFFVGLPGNPISSMVAFLLFAAPLLAALCGRTEEQPGARGPRFALARLKEAVQSKSGLTRFFPAACTFGAATPPAPADATPEVARVPWQGSGDLAAMARANCFLVVPEESESLDAGALVRILLV